jgi:hypothetical protein
MHKIQGVCRQQSMSFHGLHLIVQIRSYRDVNDPLKYPSLETSMEDFCPPGIVN